MPERETGEVTRSTGPISDYWPKFRTGKKQIWMPKIVSSYRRDLGSPAENFLVLTK